MRIKNSQHYVIIKIINLKQIHGGSFTGGSGDSFIYGPDFFINDGNVIVVTINYRLGVLGFLATGDTAAQGNWGMKDMITALQCKF